MDQSQGQSNSQWRVNDNNLSNFSSLDYSGSTQSAGAEHHYDRGYSFTQPATDPPPQDWQTYSQWQAEQATQAPHAIYTPYDPSFAGHALGGGPVPGGNGAGGSFEFASEKLDGTWTRPSHSRRDSTTSSRYDPYAAPYASSSQSRREASAYEARDLSDSIEANAIPIATSANSRPPLAESFSHSYPVDHNSFLPSSATGHAVYGQYYATGPGAYSASSSSSSLFDPNQPSLAVPDLHQPTGSSSIYPNFNSSIESGSQSSMRSGFDWRTHFPVYDGLSGSSIAGGSIASASASSTDFRSAPPSNASSASLADLSDSSSLSVEAITNAFGSSSASLGAPSRAPFPSAPSSVASGRSFASELRSPSRSSVSTGSGAPSEVDPSLPVVLLATEQRLLMAGMPTSASRKPRPSAEPTSSGNNSGEAVVGVEGERLPEPTMTEKAGKVTISMSIGCWRCATPLAGLILRGGRVQFAEPYHAAYFCIPCGGVSVDDGLAEVEESLTAAERSGEELTYAHTFSAALDRLQGLEIAPDDDRPPAVRTKRPASAASQKSDDEQLQCDVCMRTIGVGGMYVSATRQPVQFQIEIVCAPCSHRYKRCSDCGGGGGPRVGVGKWRCKELFEEGRKNCILSHARQGADQDQSYDVWEIRHIPLDEKDELIEACRNLFSTTMMSMIANPELLEANKPMARNFGEVLKLTSDWWSAFVPSFRDDIEPTKKIRRYLGLRWSTAALRKKAKGKAAAATAAAASAADLLGFDFAIPQSRQRTPDRPTSVLRGDKVLQSFIIGEWDIFKGSFFVSLVMPKGTGHVYDHNTKLMQMMIKQAERDAHSLRQFATTVPLVKEVWTMLVYKKESHFLNRDGARRGFIPLEDYIAQGGDPSHFPPEREVFLPPEFLKGWLCVARRWGPGADLTAAPTTRPRKRKAGGKEQA